MWNSSEALKQLLYIYKLVFLFVFIRSAIFKLHSYPGRMLLLHSLFQVPVLYLTRDARISNHRIQYGRHWVCPLLLWKLSQNNYCKILYYCSAFAKTASATFHEYFHCKNKKISCDKEWKLFYSNCIIFRDNHFMMVLITPMDIKLTGLIFGFFYNMLLDNTIRFFLSKWANCIYLEWIAFKVMLEPCNKW